MMRHSKSSCRYKFRMNGYGMRGCLGNQLQMVSKISSKYKALHVHVVKTKAKVPAKLTHFIINSYFKLTDAWTMID